MYSIQNNLPALSVQEVPDPLELIRQNQQGLLEKMIQNKELRVSGEEGVVLLMCALRNGKFDIFNMLVNQACVEDDQGLFPREMLEAKDINEETLLHCIVRCANDDDFQAGTFSASAESITRFFENAVGTDTEHWLAENTGGDSPLDIARDLDKPHLLALMQTYLI